MAFWGVEVKPGKPVTHFCEKARGRLRISQATLGISDATTKSIVQCNVGKKSPVLLCILLPNHTESCHLDLEFEESDDVVFSVIGPRSVYLTGYYVRLSQQPNANSDSESYGVDIQDTQTEESSYHTDDDEYEDSFIDDDGTKEFSPSPVISSKVNDKLKNGKGQGRRLPKKAKVVESDKDASSPESEDWKARGRRLRKKSQIVESDKDASSPESEDWKARGRQLRKKSQVVESDKDASSPESEDEDGYLLSVFKSKRAAKTTSTVIEAKNVNQDNGRDQMHSLELANPKKKRKERSNEEDHGVFGENKEQEVEASKYLENGDHDLVSPKSSNVKKSKKRRKEKLDGPSAEGTGVESNNVAEDDKLKQESLRADSEKKKLPAANGEKEQQIDNIASVKSEILLDASQPEKKTKKKTKEKNQVEGDLNVALPDLTNSQENRRMTFENQFTNAEAMPNRTLSNGLIIEEVANGQPDGKVASQGKKVKIFYSAMLKENGHIFDSNLGKSAFKFRLGDKDVSDEWNLGIEGMHVGDKRRIIVPPSTGCGKHGMGENVPPNSWLVYDVELAGIRK